MTLFNITPTPAPRQVRSDKWNPRPMVLRYRAFKDHVAVTPGIKVTDFSYIVFHIEMPRTWSEKKKKKMDGQPHLPRPDLDNYMKALLDALYGQDSHIWRGWPEKRWARQPGIEIVDLTGVADLLYDVIRSAKADQKSRAVPVF